LLPHLREDNRKRREGAVAEPAPIFDRDDHVAARLRELGVEAENLSDSIKTGEAERRTCTRLDPLILGGVIAWGRTMRSLREQLIPKGWTPRDVFNLPLAVRPDGEFGITVATGSEHTGLRGPSPHTKYRKGVAFPVTGDRQLSYLKPGDPLRAAELPDDVWVLLLARTENEIRYELSRPSHRNRNRTIGFNSERIILPPIPIEQSVETDEDEDEDGDFDVDVDVERL
jgi:hypothetical protein